MANPKSVNAETLPVMLAVITGTPVKEKGDYIELATDNPDKAYLELSKAGLVNKGEWTGLNVTRVPRIRQEREYIQTEAPHWEEEYRNEADTIIPREYVEGSGHYKTFGVVSGYDDQISISTSKRADIRRDGNTLLMAREVIDEKAVAKLYEKTIGEKPVEEILKSMLGWNKARTLLNAFEDVKKVKPLSVEAANDDNEVKMLRDAYQKAVGGVKQAVEDSGVLDILPKEKVRDIVRRGSGLKNIP